MESHKRAEATLSKVLAGIGLTALSMQLGALGSQAATAQVEDETWSAGSGDLSQLSDHAIETLLLRGRVIARENLDVGVTLPVRLWLEHEGRQISATFKDFDFERMGLTEFEGSPPELNFKDSYRYERAAYLLDRLLGLNMVPVTVLRRLRAQEGALVAWVDGAMTEQERLRTGSSPDDVRLLIEQRASMRLFDALIYNLDNNLGNQLWTGDDWRLHLIDHTRSFRQLKSLPESFAGRPVSVVPERFEVLRSIDDSQIEETLEEVLSPGEIKALQARRRLILEKIANDRRDYGDDFVFFGRPPPPGPR